MSWTTPDDVQRAWIGEGTPTDTIKIQEWIDKAEREIKFRVVHLQERIAAEAAQTPPTTDLLDTVKDVTCAMVTRVFRNPEGVRQTNITTGPYTSSKMYGGDLPGGLGLTDDELVKLQPRRLAGAYSIDLIPVTSPFYVGN